MWSSECKEKLQVSTLYIASWYQLTLSLLSLCHFHHCLTSYNCCASCCRDNKDSVCKVHGTGYQAAVANVEAATHQRYIEFDLRYTLPLLRALSMGLHDDCIELYHLTSSPSRVQRKTENHRHVGAQGPSCLNVDLGKCQDIYTQYTVLNLTKYIPLLHVLCVS